MNNRFRQKRWNAHDTTNDVNRDQYLEAHLTSSASSSGDADEQLTDSRPLRFPLINSKSERTTSPWRSWDLAADSELTADIGQESGEHDGVLPNHLRRSTLRLQLPMQHRLMNEFYDSIRDGVWEGMVGDGRKLVMRLLNAYVRPIASDVTQQSKLLAYFLYDLRPLLKAKQRVIVYQQITEGFEQSSPDHLAILLSGSLKLSPEDKSVVLAAIRDEMLFSGSLPPSLVPAFATTVPLHGDLWKDALKVLSGMSQPKAITDGAWAVFAKEVFCATSELHPVQAVVDAATTVDSRHLQNIDLWNAYLAAASLPHATEMLSDNMPKYKVRPNLQSYAEIARKCVGTTEWATALDLFQKAHAIRPSRTDMSRDHGAYRLVLMSALRTMKASGRRDEIALVKKMVPNLRAILRI